MQLQGTLEILVYRELQHLKTRPFLPFWFCTELKFCDPHSFSFTILSLSTKRCNMQPSGPFSRLQVKTGNRFYKP